MSTTVVRALARRKIEAATIVVLSAITSLGIVRRQADAAALDAASRPVATYLSAAVAAKAPSPAPPRATGANVASGARVASSARIAELPNLTHPRVDSWIRKFTTVQRGSMATYLSRMDRYESMISRKLEARKMPEGLIYLAMIESGFNPKARSPVSASGLWQFMSATGRQYGLKVTRRVDERNNPAKSTDAALKYLADLHKQFGSWYLAAAAYNTGQGRVARIMKQVTGRTKGTDADYYRISPRLPQETRDYVPKMIAAARIGENPQRYGFSGD
jgi:membrane-bound lytic murein transglycosylase D